MKLQDYMTPDPQSVTRGTTIRDAIRRMEAGRIRHLLVLDGDQLVGIVSRRELDIVSAISALDPATSSVEMAMTMDPLRVDLQMPIATVAQILAEARVGSAIVMNEDAIAGIFTTVDALRALADAAR